MTDAHYSLYLQNIPEATNDNSHQNLADFLTEIIMVFQDLIKECVFPADWNEMIMIQNQVFLKVRKTIGDLFKGEKLFTSTIVRCFFMM